MLRIPNKGRKSYQPSAISCQQERALLTRRMAAANGFTLIEMVVVVAIIGLLLAIAVPVSTGVLNSQKVSATKMTMQLMETTFEVSRTESESARKLPMYDWGAGPKPYRDVFGQFPPCPTSALVLQSTPGNYDEYFPLPDQDTKPITGGTPADLRDRFNFLLGDPGNSLGAFPGWQKPAILTPDYLSIEFCVFWLRETSLTGKRQLDTLMSKGVMTNKDVDFVQLGTTVAARKDLFEINDAWGRPLRYSVQVPFQAVGKPSLKLMWELRSAGPDGIFEPTYDPSTNDNSFIDLDVKAGDDIVLRGPG